MSLGIPYQGSKRKIAKSIVDYIQNHNPNGVYLYDLFGGGGAISFEALKRKHFKGVFYNEFNTGVVELLKHIRTNGITPKMYEWVDRKTFEKHKNDNDWYGGFLKTCWSFGNNQRDYLFGKDIEEPKRLMHEVVVNCCVESLKKLPFEADPLIFNLPTIYDRMISLKGMVKDRIDLEQLQRLQQLQQLQRLERLERLEITNLSYEQVPITTPIENTIIYLDPPYKSTAKYQKDIDHEQFYNWVKNSPYKIYVSSYNFDLPMVMQLEHRSTLSATANNKTIEKLFCNQPETIKTTLF